PLRPTATSSRHHVQQLARYTLVDFGRVRELYRIADYGIHTFGGEFDLDLRLRIRGCLLERARLLDLPSLAYDVIAVLLRCARYRFNQLVLDVWVIRCTRQAHCDLVPAQVLHAWQLFEQPAGGLEDHGVSEGDDPSGGVHGALPAQ